MRAFFFQNILNVLANWADGPNKLVVLSQQDLTMAFSFMRPYKKGQWALHVYSIANFIASRLKWLQMTLNDFSWFIRHIRDSFGVILDHLESFKSWGDKISHTINMQCSLSFFRHSGPFLFLLASKINCFSLLRVLQFSLNEPRIKLLLNSDQTGRLDIEN